MYSGRLTARSGRVQRTFDSAERACTADVWQRGAGVYSGRFTVGSGRVHTTKRSETRQTSRS